MGFTPFGNQTWLAGKSPINRGFNIGKSLTSCPFSIGMFDYQRLHPNTGISHAITGTSERFFPVAGVTDIPEANASTNPRMATAIYWPRHPLGRYVRCCLCQTLGDHVNHVLSFRQGQMRVPESLDHLKFNVQDYPK